VNYANTTAVITGASTGIGKAVALALAARGAKVGLIARRDDLLQELAAEIRATNGTAVGVAADVTDRQAVPPWRNCAINSGQSI
jgi:NADP-dependent 3-hydroxy acid dehydrogenase YdfG